MALLTSRFDYQPAAGANDLSRRPWRTGFWTRAPVSGLLALVTAIFCGAATIAVLEASDGLPINHWRIGGYNLQPTVLLSIFATLANALYRYAFTEGVRVSWWARAQRGTSVAALHRSWDHAQSAIPAITAGRHLSLTAVASFFVVMLLIDGPLLQRASSVEVVMKQMLKPLTIPISPSPFMMGATGIYADHDWSWAPTLFNPLFSKVLQQYNARKPIVLPEFGCVGKCELDLVAPGWDVDCEDWHTPYRLMSQYEVMNLWGTEDYDGPENSQTMFSVYVAYNDDAIDLLNDLRVYRTGKNTSTELVPFPQNTIMFTSMRKSTLDGNGTLSWRNCVLREAVQRYPVIVTNTTLELKPRDVRENLTEYVVTRWSEFSGQKNWPSTLGGLWLALSRAFTGSAEIQTVGGWYTFITEDISPLLYIDVEDAADLTTFDVRWTEPIDDMISMIQELSLRTAIETTSHVPPSPVEVTDPSQSPSPAFLQEMLSWSQPYILSPNLTSVNRTLAQNVSASILYPETVYQSNRAWMAGALAIIGIAFCAILPIFGGWWHLGRAVSLSPVEIAKAFDAPLLRKTDPNSTAGNIVDDVGTMKIQYGASTAFDSERQSLRSDASKSTPNVDVVEEGAYVVARRKLHFGTKGTVETPHDGETFRWRQQEGFVYDMRSNHSNTGYGN